MFFAFRYSTACWWASVFHRDRDLNTIIGGSCYKYHFCRYKHVFDATNTSFVATKVCLPPQNIFVETNICGDKHVFVATSILLSRQETCFVAEKKCLLRQKFCFVAAEVFVAKSIPLSRQKTCYLWQFPPMIEDRTSICASVFVFSRLRKLQYGRRPRSREANILGYYVPCGKTPLT